MGSLDGIGTQTSAMVRALTVHIQLSVCAECSFPNSVDIHLIVFDFPRCIRQLGSIGCGGRLLIDFYSLLLAIDLVIKRATTNKNKHSR